MVGESIEIGLMEFGGNLKVFCVFFRPGEHDAWDVSLLMPHFLFHQNYRIGDVNGGLEKVFYTIWVLLVV